MPAGALLLLVLAATALAAGSATPGKYKASGQIAFSFRISSGFCYLAPKNLSNPKARRGTGATGLCFGSVTVAPVHLKCTGGSSLTGFTIPFSLFDRLRLSGGRSLHLKTYSYASNPQPIGFTELDLSFSGSRATGFLRATQQVANGNGATNQCDSGKLPFSARRS